MNIIYNNYEKTYSLLKEKLSWDYIDPLNLTVHSLEKEFSNIELNVQGKHRSDYIENKVQPPSLVCYFYYYLYLFNKVPSQKEYIDFYYFVNSIWIENHIGDNNLNGFQGRLSRFYPSMLRDIHFYHLLKESGMFTKVLFVLKYDLDAKIDLFVRQNKQWYGLQLRIDTKNSKFYYNKKPSRKMIKVNTELIDIPLNLNDAKSLPTKGESLKLYSDMHINFIVEKISGFRIP